jgi:hypothetical protein
MRFRLYCLGALALLGAALGSDAIAGMPSPLPTDVEHVTYLHQTPRQRFEVISFFVLGLLVCAGVVQLLWNYLQRDFPRLPRLSFAKALAGVVLWGLLFIIVLTMISGARELMTPGAWKKVGFTYRLAADSDSVQHHSLIAVRKQHLEELRTALWTFAATHNGRLPRLEETTAIPVELWKVPEGGGLKYQYRPGLTIGDGGTVIVYEPELEPERRLVLRTNGEVAALASSEISALLGKEEHP